MRRLTALATTLLTTSAFVAPPRTRLHALAAAVSPLLGENQRSGVVDIYVVAPLCHGPHPRTAHERQGKSEPPASRHALARAGSLRLEEALLVRPGQQPCGVAVFERM